MKLLHLSVCSESNVAIRHWLLANVLANAVSPAEVMRLAFAMTHASCPSLLRKEAPLKRVQATVAEYPVLRSRLLELGTPETLLVDVAAVCGEESCKPKKERRVEEGWSPLSVEELAQLMKSLVQLARGGEFSRALTPLV
jgi:hypothetical protein